MINLTKRLLKVKHSYRFFDSKLTPEVITSLKAKYESYPSLDHFKPFITCESDYFKIFHTLQQLPYSQQAYLDLRLETSEIEKPSDNLLLLRARIEAIIANAKAEEGSVEEAQAHYQKALEILEDSMVPQLLPYYQLYRKYGLFLWSCGKLREAEEVLEESVQILREFVSQSEDQVSSQYNSIEQARACMKLVSMQPKGREKWLNYAKQYWGEAEQKKYECEQYAHFVYEETLDRMEKNPHKAMLYAQVEIDRIPNEAYHPIIRKALEKKPSE